MPLPACVTRLQLHVRGMDLLTQSPSYGRVAEIESVRANLGEFYTYSTPLEAELLDVLILTREGLELSDPAHAFAAEKPASRQERMQQLTRLIVDGFNHMAADFRRSAAFNRLSSSEQRLLEERLLRIE